MDDLPYELVDKTFAFLDGLSLARSEQVCRKWQNLHKQHNYDTLWRKACLIEIPCDALDELTVSNEHSTNSVVHVPGVGQERTFITSSQPISWKEVYKEWYRSRFIGKWPSLCLELKGHFGGPVYDAKFSGEKVVTCGADSTIRIWDAWTGSCLKILQGHDSEVVCIALRRKPGTSLHDDNPHDIIASGSEDNTVCLWDMIEGLCIQRLPLPSPVSSVAIQGNIVAAASTIGSANIWNFDKNQLLFNINLLDWIQYIGFLKNSILTVTETNMLELWSVPSGQSLASEVDVRQQKGICKAALRGDTTLTLSDCGKLTAWQHSFDGSGDLDSSVIRSYTIIGPGAKGVPKAKCLAFTGSLVAIGTDCGSIYMYHLDRDWDNQFQKIHAVIQSGNTAPISVAIGDDGTGPTLLTAGHDGIVRVHRWFPYSATNITP